MSKVHRCNCEKCYCRGKVMNNNKCEACIRGFHDSPIIK